MRTFLICSGERLNHIALPRWIALFSTLAEMVVFRETHAQKRRIQCELKRIGLLRFLDGPAFRLRYPAFLAHTIRKSLLRNLG